MYSIYADDQLIYSPTMTEDGYAAITPKLSIGLNRAGSLEFKLPPNNPMYDRIKKLKSIISVQQDGKEIWYGRELYDKSDFFKRKNIYVEGALSFLNDSIVSPYSVFEPLEDYFSRLILQHNFQVDQSKQFDIGSITVPESKWDRSLVRADSTYPKTFDVIDDKLLKNVGGYLFTRRQNGRGIIDYLASSGELGTQVLEFGKNLLDIEQYISAENIVTVLIPLGGKNENDVITTIESVNEGRNYIESPTGISMFGKIVGTKTWSDVYNPSNLLRKGTEALADNLAESVTITIKAIDLHLIDVNTEELTLGNYYRVRSPQHGLNASFQLTDVTIDMENPQNNVYTFGMAKTGISSKTASVNIAIDSSINEALKTRPTMSKAHDIAVESVTQALNEGIGGHTQLYPDEFLIMDTVDKDTATNLWRWNMNGLGFSSNGYEGPYETAITSDGHIVADLIDTGILNANILRSGIISSWNEKSWWNLETGEFNLHSESVMISDGEETASLTTTFKKMQPVVVQIESSAGNIFKNKGISTLLTARVYSGIEDVTDQITEFRWYKNNADGTRDESWSRVGGNTIQISPADVTSKAVFYCEVDYDPTPVNTGVNTEEGNE